MPQGTSSSVNIVILGLISVFLLSTPVFRSAPGKRHSQHESHGHDHKHGNDEHDQSSMTMNMVFTNSYRTTLWFSTVQTETPAAYFAVLCGLCLLAVVSEGLAQYRNARAGASQADELYRATAVQRSERAAAAGLHVLYIGIGYMLMLAVMTYNVGMCLAVLCGFGLGHYLYADPQRVQIGGSLIGGIRETQEMLDFCTQHGVAAITETIPITQVNEAYTRMIKSDVKYRFVIDITGSLVP